MWRLIYSKHKLSRSQRTQLQQVLDDYTYTCGAKLVELNLGNSFKEVEVQDHLCGDPVEKLYYLSLSVCTVQEISRLHVLINILNVPTVLIILL